MWRCDKYTIGKKVAKILIYNEVWAKISLMGLGEQNVTKNFNFDRWSCTGV